jgi:glycosyltransferase involved in cell wall biosynthesis
LSGAAFNPRRLRVVFLGHCAALSGAELGLVDLIGALEDVVEPLVILAEDGPLVARLEAIGVPVELLPLPARARLVRRGDVRLGAPSMLTASITAGAYSLRLARRLRRLRPDIVHANTLKAFLYGMVAARLAGAPLVWHVHDRIADDYLPRTAVRLMHAAARHGAAGLIVNSATTLAALGPLETPATIIYEPVPHPFCDGAVPRKKGGPFTAVMVGRIAPWKGQDVFLRAFAAAFPAGDERAVIVGAPLFGEDDYLASLRRLIDELGLERRVALRGFRADVAAELSRADALVHASIIPEPFGRVVVEGMAAGLPVVAARAGGPSEIVSDGVDGLLYRPGHVESLAAALRRIATDPELAGRLGGAATQRARAFAPEVAAQKTRAFYNEIVAKAAA